MKGKTILMSGSGADKHMHFFESREAYEQYKKANGCYGKVREVELVEEFVHITEERIMTDEVKFNTISSHTESNTLSALIRQAEWELDFKANGGFFRWATSNDLISWHWVIKRKDGSIAWESDYLTVKSKEKQNEQT